MVIKIALVKEADADYGKSFCAKRFTVGALAPREPSAVVSVKVVVTLSLMVVSSFNCEPPTAVRYIFLAVVSGDGPVGIAVRLAPWLPDVVVRERVAPGVDSPYWSTKVTAHWYAPIPRLVLAASAPAGAAGGRA